MNYSSAGYGFDLQSQVVDGYNKGLQTAFAQSQLVCMALMLAMISQFAIRIIIAQLKKREEKHVEKSYARTISILKEINNGLFFMSFGLSIYIFAYSFGLANAHMSI